MAEFIQDYSPLESPLQDPSQDLESQPWSLKVRESKRAKHVTLKITVLGEVEIVIPQGYNRSHLADIVAARQGWIEAALKRVERHGRSLDPNFHSVHPTTLELLALAENWHIVYLNTSCDRITMTTMSDRTLSLVGNVSQATHCQRTLCQWLKRKAELDLVPQLHRISQAIELPYTRVGIRGQKTRWGSCSSQKHISLNYKLLFLPQPLVHYVLVHELCHTVHLNHSAKFWHLVAAKMPHYLSAKHQLKQAWRYVPQWVEAQS
ncbi:MAG: SprT family zinc-dependent metalloprotease [Cyanobacteria bacterium J06639_16]